MKVLFSVLNARMLDREASSAKKISITSGSSILLPDGSSLSIANCKAAIRTARVSLGMVRTTDFFLELMVDEVISKIVSDAPASIQFLVDLKSAIAQFLSNNSVAVKLVGARRKASKALRRNILRRAFHPLVVKWLPAESRKHLVEVYLNEFLELA